MLAAAIVAILPAAVYRVLKGAGLMGRRQSAPRAAGEGLCPALKAARAVARCCQRPQHLRHLLFPLRCA